MARLDPYGGRYPLLPFKNVVILPRNVVTLLVGRARSIQAVEEAMGRDRRIVVTAHRDPEVDDPRPGDLHSIGTMAEIISVERQQGNNIQVVLEGLYRADVMEYDNSRSFYMVRAEEAHEDEVPAEEAQALLSIVRELAKRYSETKGKLNADVLEMLQQTSDASHFADLLTAQLMTDATRRQSYLETLNPAQRLEQLAIYLTGEVELADLESRIKSRVREQIDKNQREYYLREQLKAIHDELSGEAGNEMEVLREKIREANLPEHVSERLLREVTRLERMPSVSAEATVVRNYIDTVLALPWTTTTEDRLDLDHAEGVLNDDHHGLEQVKERILEFLAVRSLMANLERDTPTTSAGASILCLVGPPGVGKTSLGRSVARAMGREFVRVSLGGVRDEAEIRGHRRTYIGAFPGRIVGAMKTAGTLNPVVLLDEIDKMSSDYRGDPASAMLEVLDPEQNREFTDHFLDMPFDLSQVLFITTANYLGNIPRPLRDRMEIIDISGYTEQEKVAIGRRHLLPRQLTAHGLAEGTLEISDKLWMRIVRDYTREAGVRGLERQLAALCRKVAREMVQSGSVASKAKDASAEDAEDTGEDAAATPTKAATAVRKGRLTRGKDGKVRLTEARLVEFLGPKKFGSDHTFRDAQIGVSVGLAATEVGGVIIPVEVAVMPGKGALTITGQAGEVMQESARAALSYMRSRAEALQIPTDFQEKIDLHIHLPEGATPKEGPSAGITMCTALISAVIRRPVRHDIAMTGEITLRGRVLPIGGLKEKTLAAHRVGIRQVIAPAENERDLTKVPESVRNEMTFHWVEHMDEVLALAIISGDDMLVPEKLEDSDSAVLPPSEQQVPVDSDSVSQPPTA